MIIVDLGSILLLFAIILIGGILLGTVILEKVISFLFGPFKIGAVIIIIITILLNIYRAFDDDSNSKMPSRIVGAAFSSIGSALRYIISVIFFLCIMLGFLKNIEQGHILWAAFAIFSDIIVFILLFCGCMGINVLVTSLIDKIPMFLIGIINLILSSLYFMITQSVILGFYKGAVAELFANQQWLVNFIMNDWFEIMFNAFGIL